jgi:hypothetical protein
MSSIFNIPNSNVKSEIIGFQKKEIAPPKIIFTTNALLWMKALVDVHEIEVGWRGLVDVKKTDNVDSYIIDEIIYPKHLLMTHGTCEIDEMDVGNTLIARPTANEDMWKLRFWGHSHHTMDVSPSEQDNTMALDLLKRSQDYLIRAICNKKMEMSISFYDFKNDVKFDHVQWMYINSSNDERIKEIEQKHNEIIASLEPIVGKEVATAHAKEICKKMISEINDSKYKEIRDQVVELRKRNEPAAQTTVNFQSDNLYRGRNGISYGYGFDNSNDFFGDQFDKSFDPVETFHSKRLNNKKKDHAINKTGILSFERILKRG